MTLRLVAFALPALALAGCTVGPDYAAPGVDLPATFAGARSQTLGDVSAQAWWTGFRDPLLDELALRGLARNLDVAAAVERIDEARANLRATGLNAQLDGSLYGSLTREGGNRIATETGRTAGLDAGFVIDLFGGYRRESQSAEAALAAAQADVETTRLAWLAELVAAYADARYYQEALQLTRDTIATREETVAVIRRQLEFGAATEYGLAEGESLLATARAQLPQYAALFNSSVFAIAALMDEPSAPLLARMQPGAPMLHIPEGEATGVPAELLRGRPDVRFAEATLAGSVYDVGVAESALYPSLTLLGSVSVGASVNTWAFGPTLSLPVLNRGTLAASRDAALSRARQAEIDWRASVRGAVQDVEVALSNLKYDRARARALRQAADAYERALRLARENYRAGAITLLDLLDTDRETATARIAAAAAVNQASQSWASLQIAVGSGANPAVALAAPRIDTVPVDPEPGGVLGFADYADDAAR